MICIQPWPLPAECASPEQFLLPNTAMTAHADPTNAFLLLGGLSLILGIVILINWWTDRPVRTVAKPNLKPHAKPFSEFSAKRWLEPHEWPPIKPAITDWRKLPAKPTMNPHPYPVAFNPHDMLSRMRHSTAHPDCEADWMHSHSEWL